MEISDTAKAILDQNGWDKLDPNKGIKEKLFKRAEFKDRADTIFHTFDTEAGKRTIEMLVEMFLTKPIANPHDDMLSVGIREGQARVVKWLLAQRELSSKG